MAWAGQRQHHAHHTTCGSSHQQVLAPVQCLASTGRHSTQQLAAASRHPATLISSATMCAAHPFSSAAWCCSPAAPQLRHCCFSGAARLHSTVAFAAAASGPASGGGRNKIVFLGTPEVAAGVLEQLLNAADSPDADFEVSLLICDLWFLPPLLKPACLVSLLESIEMRASHINPPPFWIAGGSGGDAAWQAARAQQGAHPLASRGGGSCTRHTRRAGANAGEGP